MGRERTMMVGDSSVDVQTARNAGIACCGVTYGFQPETLDSTPPNVKVDRMEQMVALGCCALPHGNELDPMNHKPGTVAPVTGIYWCSVCKTPARFTAGETLPECPNFCGRGLWELVEKEE